MGRGFSTCASVAFALALAACTVATKTFAEINIVPGHVQFLAQTPEYVATGDFDRDGFMDAAVTDGTSSNLTILFGDGRLGFREVKSVQAGRRLQGVVAVDLDSNGCLDLAAADPVSTRVVYVLNHDYYGRCGDYLDWNSSQKVGASPLDLAVGHFDGSGNPSVVTANQGYPVTVLGLTKLFACKPELPGGGTPRRVFVADLNEDGLDDVITINTHKNPPDNLSVYLNDGEAQFCAPTASFSVHGDPEDAVVGDFNNDGAPDLAVLATNNTVSLLLNHADRDGDAVIAGLFDVPLRISTYCWRCLPRAITAADYDADGNLDFAVAHQMVPLYETSIRIPGRVSVFPGRGDGDFDYEVTAEVGLDPRGLASADFTNDNVSDIVVAAYASQAVQLLGLRPDLYRTGVECDWDAQCVSGLCVDAVCCSNMCVNDERCDIPYDRGSCTPRLHLGRDCTAEGQCVSQSCVHGFCCESRSCPAGESCDSGRCLSGASPFCTGDCDGNGTLTVDEIIELVQIALGSAALVDCPQGDADGDEKVSADEIIAAVAASLEGCSARAAR